MKKTDIDKVIARGSYRITYKINRLKEAPYKEQIIVRNFSAKT